MKAIQSSYDENPAYGKQCDLKTVWVSVCLFVTPTPTKVKHIDTHPWTLCGLLRRIVLLTLDG